MKKIVSALVLTILFFSFIPIVESEQTPGIFLIESWDDWTVAGFSEVPKDGRIYTRYALCDFFLPLALKKEDVNNLKPSDVEHTIYHGNQAFQNRYKDTTFTIFESDTYYVVQYHMMVSASKVDDFSVDFVPKIKGEESPYISYAWFDSSYSYSCKLEINQTYVNETLYSFPTLVKFTDNSDIYNETSSVYGHEVRFVWGDNDTIMPHEIESWNAGGGVVNAAIWVNVSKVFSGNNTVFWMYTGADGVDPLPQAIREQTWNASCYTGVYLLNESSGATCYDSTVKSNDGTYNGDLPTLITENGLETQDFDGNTDYIALPSGCWLNHAVDPYGTIMYYFVPDDLGAHDVIYMQWDGDGSDFVYLREENTGGTNFRGVKNGGTEWGDSSYGNLDAGAWEWISGKMAVNNVKLFENEVQRMTDGSCAMPDDAYSGIYLGSDTMGTDFDGHIDQVRVSKGVGLSDEYMKCCYYTTCVDDFLLEGDCGNQSFWGYSDEDDEGNDTNATATTSDSVALDGTQFQILLGILIILIIWFFAEKREDVLLFWIVGVISLPFGIFVLTQAGIGNMMSIYTWIGIGFVLLSIYFVYLGLAYSLGYKPRK